jgi:glycosyltransferase involved in cell wall biosynthesis
MIKGRDIIIFSDDWGRYPSTLQHIGKILARHNRIIWVGSLGLRQPKLSLTDIKRIAEKFKRIFFKKKGSGSNKEVIEVNPVIIPFHDWTIIRKINSLLLIKQLKKILNKHRFVEPILITTSPIMEKLVGKLNESSSHYFCLDDFTLFEGAFECIGMLEQNLLKKVSTSFSISENLMRSRVPASGRNYFLPQGVDIKHFMDKVETVPDKIKNLPRPIIGFFGLIAPWIDLELVINSAARYPDYTFLLIGKSAVDLDMIEDYQNIIYTGEIPFRQLPAYARTFDVGLIPFKINELTLAANPLKLLEYLSLGIPVVSTDLPEVRKFEKYVYVAMDEEEFIELIQKAADEKSDEQKKLRIEEAQKYSWETITENVSEIILQAEKKLS